MSKGEDNLVAWLTGRTRGDGGSDPHGADPCGGNVPDGVTIGIGDDMALLETGGALLVTADMLMDGVHFNSAVHAPNEIGRKALAASLSDCAAMAVRPRWAMVSVALPEVWSMEQARELFRGIEALARVSDCGIVGGDTNSWSRPLVVDVTVLATPYPDVTPVRRDGALPGDELFVTGRLGGSLRGHHLTFTPRVEEARALGRRLGSNLHAMMDLSDGLSTDAGRMATASGHGLLFDAEAIERVASAAALAASREDGHSPLNHALHDGEDYELLFAAAAGGMERSETNPEKTDSADGRLMECLTRIGVVIEEPGVWLLAADGVRTPLESAGWQHFT